MNCGPEVARALARTFDAATARHLGEKFAAAVLPSVNQDRDRVFLAIVILSRGDARRALRELAEAQKDWRDTLCAAGLEGENWREAVRVAGFTPPP
jgi:hypothetical protein